MALMQTGAMQTLKGLDTCPHMVTGAIIPSWNWYHSFCWEAKTSVGLPTYITYCVKCFGESTKAISRSQIDLLPLSYNGDLQL